MVRTTLKKRDLYLSRMIAFQDTEMIKVKLKQIII